MGMDTDTTNEAGTGVTDKLEDEMTETSRRDFVKSALVASVLADRDVVQAVTLGTDESTRQMRSNAGRASEVFPQSV
ncbi:MAG: hypothetical protein SXQ77_00435, partial [Halobacteria archaeon]|nr:hypothetical protein [Halobacteria archaeon]